jgi:hypothetical protein
MATTVYTATKEIEIALSQLRLLHTVQTGALIEQARALFTLEAAMIEQEKQEENNKKTKRTRKATYGNK